jgi:hypothetical protein
MREHTIDACHGDVSIGDSCAPVSLSTSPKSASLNNISELQFLLK